MFVPKSVICLRDYSLREFGRDAVAGVTVGIVALPLAMAFAIASGVEPQRGIFTAIVAGFLISALGGSRVQIGGPTGAFVVLVFTIMAKYGYDGLCVCTAMAGLLLMAMGVFRFGGMIKFISFPVITGFTSGIAVIIFSSQIKDLLGLQIKDLPADFFSKWATYAVSMGSINWQATAVGAGTIGVIIALRRTAPRLPGMIVAMALSTVIVWALRLKGVETIEMRFGGLPHMLPSPRIPRVELSHLRELVQPAVTIALLAAIESLLSATVADGMIGSRHKSNMELVAQGVANIGSAVFGGIPATGAIARTATNIKCGGRTPVAGMIHSVTLLAILVLFAPLAKLVPLASLAGILVVVSYQMSEIEQFGRILRSPRSDVAVLLATFVLTVAVDLTVAVQVGVVLTALLFIRRMSEVTNVGSVTRDFQDAEETPDPNASALRDIPPGVEIYEINGPFFFGAAESFKETMSLIEKPPRVFILRMRNVPAVDATGLHILAEFHRRCLRDGTHLLLSDVHTQPIVALMRSHVWDEIGEENITGNLDDALIRARQLLGLAESHRTRQFTPTVRREMTGLEESGTDSKFLC